MVIGNLYEEDGLANNECNRWSALKMKDGRLCFGSVGGVTIIDPALWKSPTKGRRPPFITLTELYSDTQDEASIGENHLTLLEQNQRIVLPASNRNLKASFTLSNYASPEKSIFAYQIEGVDKEWHYLGNQRQLSLTALPAGNYNILIKGSDGRGKWSDLPIVIPVQAKEFFYKQWWFFVLCALPFLVFLLLWQIRQRGERKRLEQEVSMRTATIQEQAEKLLEMDQVKSRLYTNITHEFRTPLTVISGMTDLIDQQPAKAKELINRNSKGLLRLVNQMLDLAKLESGHLQLEMVQADIVPYIQYLLESFHSYGDSKNIQLTFQKEVDRVVMDFDEKKMESIISNLLSNAIKFSKENGQVNLLMRVENNQLLLQVKDNGIGISPEKLPHVFDRFYQVDNSSTRQGEGTGIGLTLTKELVELMGGEISVESSTSDGIGTVFTVRLPITQNSPVITLRTNTGMAKSYIPTSDEVASNGYLLNPSEDSPLTTHHSPLPLLLLIEDNEDVATYIEECLKTRYTVDWASNGAMGIEKALETIPDIIISDVMMPEKDGYEVCQTLKNDERTSHIPIVLLTAKADVESRLEGLGVGADAYLAKPFLKEELYVRLEKLVELRQKLQARYVALIRTNNTPSAVSSELSLDDLFLQKIHDLVIANLDDADFGYEQVAQQMLLSQSQLFRKVKALTDQSVSVFIRSIRLQKGKELLQESELTVSEIAYQTGFSDPHYFSRTFSKEFGVSPKSMRK